MKRKKRRESTGKPLNADPSPYLVESPRSLASKGLRSRALEKFGEFGVSLFKGHFAQFCDGGVKFFHVVAVVL